MVRQDEWDGMGWNGMEWNGMGWGQQQKIYLK